MTNQGDRQESIRAVTGTAYDYNGDWHALWDLQSVPSGTYNERMLSWINTQLSSSYTNVNDAMAAYAISQGVDSWNELGTFSAGVSTPLRTVSSSNRMFSSSDINATRDTFVFNTPYTLTPTNDLIFRFDNWGYGSTGWTAGYSAFDIVEASVTIGATTIPLRFSGSRSKSFSINDTNIVSDTLYPSDFGLGSFTHGSTVWLKGKVNLPAINTRFFTLHHRSTAEASGAQLSLYDRAATTVSSTDVAGAYTVVSGAALFNRTALWGPILIGHPLTDGPTFGLVGDSIGGGLTDTITDLGSGGFFNKSLFGSGGTDILPGLNLSVGGTNSTMYYGNTYVQTLYQYCKYWGFQHAANDIGTSGTVNLTTMQTRTLNMYSDFTAGGATKIFHVPPFGRTTSTDSWATTANQTYQTGWAVSGVADTYRTFIADKLADNTIQMILPSLPAMDGTETLKFLTNGTAGWGTGDGLHLKQPLNALLVTSHSPLMRTM